MQDTGVPHNRLFLSPRGWKLRIKEDKIFAYLCMSTHRIQETNEDHGLTWSTAALPHLLSNHFQGFRTLKTKQTYRGI